MSDMSTTGTSGVTVKVGSDTVQLVKWDGEYTLAVEDGNGAWTKYCPDDDVEVVLRALDRLSRRARQAGKVAGTLDDKLKYRRLQTMVEAQRRDLRKAVFDFEDAAKLAEKVTTCESCGEETVSEEL